MISREVAWRVFAAEYNASTLEERYSEENEKTPNYVITPLGAKINRIFIVGTVTEIENFGSENEPFWRARISDPTGVFYISAGQYQPEASKTLALLRARVFEDLPPIVAVIGKARVYSPDDERIYVSVMPESIKEVNKKIRNYWILDTCRHMMRRIDAMKEAMKMTSPNTDELVKLGYGRNLAEGVVKAVKHYELVDIEMYENTLHDLLANLASEKEIEDNVLPIETAQIDKDLENEILELIEKFETEKGASWEAIMEEAGKKGKSKGEIEEAINSLMDKGIIYEPVLGYLKKI